MKFIHSKRQLRSGKLYIVKDLDAEAMYISRIDKEDGLIFERITDESPFNDYIDISEVDWHSSLPETDKAFDSALGAFYEIGNIDDYPEYLI